MRPTFTNTTNLDLVALRKGECSPTNESSLSSPSSVLLAIFVNFLLLFSAVLLTKNKRIKRKKTLKRKLKTIIFRKVTSD